MNRMVANNSRIELKIKTGTEPAMLVTYSYTSLPDGRMGWRQRRHKQPNGDDYGQNSEY